MLRDAILFQGFNGPRKIDSAAGLLDSIVAYWEHAADFCNTIGGKADGCLPISIYEVHGLIEASLRWTCSHPSRQSLRMMGPAKPARKGPGIVKRAERRTTPARAGAARRPLLIIDGDFFAHRAYHGLPKTIRRSDGGGGGAIVGFANSLLRLYQSEQPRAVLVGWDTLDAPTYRHEAFDAYQSDREFDEELLDQLNLLPKLVSACGFVSAKAPGYEADDFLAAATAAEERWGGTAVVASGDRDAFQLVSESTVVLHPVRGGEMARIGPPEVRERYGVEPNQVPDFIALRGDPSDKLPGAKGVGPKGAAVLLCRYGSLENALAAGCFAAQADALRLYRRIATMDASAPIPPLPSQVPKWEKASSLARKWGLMQLADRLRELAQNVAKDA